MKQQQLYINLEVLEALIKSSSVGFSQRNAERLYKTALTHSDKAGWVHFHKFNNELVELYKEFQTMGWRALGECWMITRLQHLMHRAKVKRGPFLGEQPPMRSFLVTRDDETFGVIQGATAETLEHKLRICVADHLVVEPKSIALHNLRILRTMAEGIPYPPLAQLTSIIAETDDVEAELVLKEVIVY